MSWIILAVAVVILALIGYWLLVIAEGVYLGPRIVRLLYDWTAPRYDKLKDFNEAEEAYFLGQPLATALGNHSAPCVLDVATGSGRLPRTLLRQPDFGGRVFGSDVSAKMLRVAEQHLEPQAERVGLLVAPAAPLPFTDEGFEAVTCLEALEFFPSGQVALEELVRVLRPGGWLLITNRTGWEAHLMPGHTWSRAQLIEILRRLSLTDISVRPWQTYYDLVWARKRNVNSYP